MKKEWIVLFLVLVMIPTSLAVNIDIGIGSSVDVQPSQSEPLVFTDSTARMWCPNDETWYTTNYFGTNVTAWNGTAYIKTWVDECAEGTGWEVPLRQNYLFSGEKIKTFLLVYDADGIEEVTMLGYVRLAVFDGATERENGACALAPKLMDGNPIPAAYDAMMPDGTPITTFDEDTMAEYECTLIAPDAWKGEMEIKAKVHDVDGFNVYADESDWLYFNPDIQLDIKGGPVDFGTVTPGGDAYSNTIALKNVAVPDANGDYGGVVLDMYIAADDYFTDPSTPGAICPNANGIPYYAFSYYATKGSIDSGANTNFADGIGVQDGTMVTHVIDGASTTYEECKAGTDEYTRLPSYSSHIEDMCRIINSDAEDSVLVQGAEMSITFQLDVPKPCVGTFSSGQFHFWGEVI